jgi:flagellar protein FliO/FliZ
MIGRGQPMNYYKVFVCFIFFMGVFHPLETILVQADDNKSVLKTYQEEDGQVPGEDEKSQIDQQVSTENENSQEDEPVPASDEDIQVGTGLTDQSLFGMFFKLFIALAAVIFMIYALIRFIGRRSQSYQTHRTLQNIGGVHIGSNRSIQLVRVGERVLVVGVGETIQLLKEIDDHSEVKKIVEDYEVQEVQQQLSSAVSWVKSKLNGHEESHDSKQYFKGLLERQLTDVKNSQKQAHVAIKEREQ